ncbi:MAG: hypothetical protein AB7E55_30950 [Pigmentiphaga sp.]
MMAKPPRFTAQDAEHAFDTWGSNCGPAALAAIAGLTLDEVRPHMGDFEAKHYTNPTLMWAAMKSAGLHWRTNRTPTAWPKYGLCRVQWEGPWTAPGVPIRVRYRHTHWVGAARVNGQVVVFDVNALGNGTGWCSLKDWSEILVPWILRECVPRANGQWHLTHVAEVDR